MAVVEVQVGRVDLVTDAPDALLEHALQTAIPIPCAIVMVDRMIADFLDVLSLSLLKSFNQFPVNAMLRLDSTEADQHSRQP